MARLAFILGISNCFFWTSIKTFITVKIFKIRGLITSHTIIFSAATACQTCLKTSLTYITWSILFSRTGVNTFGWYGLIVQCTAASWALVINRSNTSFTSIVAFWTKSYGRILIKFSRAVWFTRILEWVIARVCTTCLSWCAILRGYYSIIV